MGKPFPAIRNILLNRMRTKFIWANAAMAKGETYRRFQNENYCRQIHKSIHSETICICLRDDITKTIV